MPLKKNPISPLPILFLCLFVCGALLACARPSVSDGAAGVRSSGPNRAADGKVSTGAQKKSFAATGLLAHPGETAEELLLRAHTYHPEAMPLVIAGYSLGIGGFPRSESLTGAYLPMPWLRYDYNTIAFLSLMHVHTNVPEMSLNKDICHPAGRSVFVQPFRRAGIFDLDTMCAGVEIKRQDNPGTFDIIGKWERENSRLKTLMSELIARPMTGEEAKFLTPGSSSGKHPLDEFLGYYIAAGGNSNASAPEKQLNLLRFIAMRKLEFFQASVELRKIAADASLRLVAADVYMPLTLEIIRKAHAGDKAAARQMAENYRTGAMGFPKNSSIAKAWLYRAAGELESRKAVDSLPLWSYLDKSDEFAWLTGQLGLRYGDPEMDKVFAWIIEEAEKRLPSADLKEHQKLLDEVLDRRGAAGYQPK